MAIINRNADSSGSANVTNPNYLSVTADLAVTAWKTAATHEVFTVTGLVRMKMWIECTETLEDAADAVDIQFGHALATDAFIAVTGAAGKGASTITAGEIWYDTTPTTVLDTAANAIMDYVINATDVGYEITGAALTNGLLVFHCVWEALNATGNVVAGAGGALS